MPVEERRRVSLHRLLSEAFGEEAADTLFALVTPAGETPATERNIDDLRVATERSIDELRASTERSIDELRVSTERSIDELRASTETGFARLDGRIDGLEQRLDGTHHRFEGMEHRFEGMEHRLEGMEHRLTAAFERRLSETFTAQTRTLVFSQLGAVVTIAALAFGLR